MNYKKYKIQAEVLDSGEMLVYDRTRRRQNDLMICMDINKAKAVAMEMLKMIQSFEPPTKKIHIEYKGLPPLPRESNGFIEIKFKGMTFKKRVKFITAIFMALFFGRTTKATVEKIITHYEN